MPYKLQPGRMYMMPTHFGPAAGPRQGPDGGRFDGVDSPRTTSYSVSFLTRPEQLEVLLPAGFRLAGDPAVTVTVSYMTEIEWLAGRGYNTLGVSFPAEYRGKRDRARGPFLAVLWENLADPILTGREQLGFSKIFCAIPPPSVLNDETRCTADWLGFRFMEMNLSEMETPPATEAKAPTGPVEASQDAGRSSQRRPKFPRSQPRQPRQKRRTPSLPEPCTTSTYLGPESGTRPMRNTPY